MFLLFILLYMLVILAFYLYNTLYTYFFSCGMLSLNLPSLTLPSLTLPYLARPSLPPLLPSSSLSIVSFLCFPKYVQTLFCCAQPYTGLLKRNHWRDMVVAQTPVFTVHGVLPNAYPSYCTLKG